ncbi:chemotaxis protein CheW [bacterium]|nr:chemotaxis protein CheW [bacterium]
MNESNQYVVFTLDEQQYALHLSVVERVIRVVEVAPLPKGPEMVLGVVNVQGQIIPVFNIRKQFRLPEREIDLNDQLIIAYTSSRTVAILVDAVSGVIEPSEQEITTTEKIMPNMEYVESVVKVEDGMIFLLHDLDEFLSFEEKNTPMLC